MWRKIRLSFLMLLLITLCILAISPVLPHYQAENAVVKVMSGGGSGTGMVVKCWQNDDGLYSAYVLTAAHVIDGSWMPPRIKDFDESGYTMDYVTTVVIKDNTTDVALLRIDDMTRPLLVIKLADVSTFYADLDPGDTIKVIGCGLGNPPHSKIGTLNFENTKNTEYSRRGGSTYMLGYNTPIIYGDSGGALVNEDGELIGIVNSLSIIRMPVRVLIPPTYDSMGVPQGGGIVHGQAIVSYEHLNYGVPLTKIIQVLRSHKISL